MVWPIICGEYYLGKTGRSMEGMGLYTSGKIQLHPHQCKSHSWVSRSPATALRCGASRQSPTVSNSEQTSVELRHPRGSKSSSAKNNLPRGRLLKNENFSISVFVRLQRHNNAACFHLICADRIQRCSPLRRVRDLHYD